MTRPEKAKAIAILDDYVAHLISTKNKSLLARIYGIFTLKTKLFEPVDFMIMQNTALLAGMDQEKLCCFDLKGSTVNRYTKLPAYDLHQSNNNGRVTSKSVFKAPKTEAEMLLDGTLKAK